MESLPARATSSLPTRFAIRRPEVVSEVFDAETVVVDLVAGRYYAFNPMATAIWSQLAARPTLDEIAASFAPAFGDLEQARAELAPFLDRLVEAGLLLRVADAPEGVPASGPELLSVAAASPLPPADFEVFTDLEDLLVLDPIHDLDESGWPSPPARAVEAGE
jgi:hypothetical protein